MAEKVLIMGESGTGKSTSMRNCNPAEIAVVNPVGKTLPFRAKFDSLDGITDARQIVKFMKDQVKKGKKIIVVDDFQYILSIPYMNRIKEAGWDKWNDFGANYFEVIDVCNEIPDDVIVYYMTHTETLEDGTTTIKLIGKLLREKITIEGLYTIVLRTSVQDGKYYFLTQNSGKDTVKSPLGMFNSYAIDNDLKYVDEKIRNYYSIGDFLTDEEVKEIDKLAEKVDVIKPDPDGKKRRTRKKEEQKPTIPEEIVDKDKIVEFPEDEETEFDDIKEDEFSQESHEQEFKEVAAKPVKRQRRNRQVEDAPKEEPAKVEEAPKRRRRQRILE